MPIYRRRGVPLGDLGALCAGIRDTVGPQLNPDELAVATRSLDAAIAVFARDGRLAGDTHKREHALEVAVPRRLTAPLPKVAAAPRPTQNRRPA